MSMRGNWRRSEAVSYHLDHFPGRDRTKRLTPSVRLVSEEAEIRMKRIATRTFALFVSGLFVLGTVAACASEDTTGSPFKAASPDGGKTTQPKVCMVMYCPMPAGGKACCLMDGTCGVDPGTGCVPMTKKDGG
jgi:hypothetical protein